MKAWRAIQDVPRIDLGGANVLRIDLGGADVPRIDLDGISAAPM